MLNALFDRGGKCQHDFANRARRATSQLPAGHQGRPTHGDMPGVPGHDRYIWQEGAACREMLRM